MKKYFKLFLACVIVAAFAICVSAVEGTFGESLTWTYDEEGTLTIDGEGAIPDNAFKRKNFQKVNKLVIGDGITSIGKGAFSYASNLKSVTVPANVTEIGAQAFYDCSELEEVVLLCRIELIEESTFAFCDKLAKISIPESVKTIGQAAFWYCYDLTELRIPNGVERIERSAMSNCGLEKVTLPKTLKYLGYEAICASKLKEIHFEGTVSEWVSIEIEYVSRPPVNSDYALYIGGDIVKNLTFTSDVTTINRYAFAGCTSIESAVFPSTLKEIGFDAFTGCTALSSVTFEEGVETVKEDAFFGCASLKNVIIPASVKHIGHRTFLTGALESATVLSMDAEIGSDAFGNAKILCYADSTVHDYAKKRGLEFSILNDDGSVTTPEKLDAPTKLGFVDENGNFTGCLYFDGVEGGTTYVVKFYFNGRIIASTKVLRHKGESVTFRIPFEEFWTESGEYSFTVKALGDGVNCTDSDTVHSEKFCFELSKEKLDTPTDMEWSNAGRPKFSPVRNAIGYEYNFYAVAAGEYEYLYTVKSFPMVKIPLTENSLMYTPSPKLEARWYMEENGVDSVDIVYTVCALSGNLLECDNSELSDYSEPYTFTEENSFTLFGDADIDGGVTIRDAAKLLQYLAGWTVDIDISGADVDGDGKITIRDAARILQYKAGWDVTLG